MSLLVDMRTLLTSINSNIYLGDIPDDVDACIALYNTGGRSSTHSFDQVTVENPSFQVRVRNTSYATALTQAESVKTALDGKVNTTINSNVYLSIFLRSDILSIGRDDRNRVNLTINFEAQVKNMSYVLYIPSGSDSYITSDGNTFKVKEAS